MIYTRVVDRDDIEAPAFSTISYHYPPPITYMFRKTLYYATVHITHPCGTWWGTRMRAENKFFSPDFRKKIFFRKKFFPRFQEKNFFQKKIFPQISGKKNFFRKKIFPQISGNTGFVFKISSNKNFFRPKEWNPSKILRLFWNSHNIFPRIALTRHNPSVLW